MSPTQSTGISNEKFAPWLRRELLRAVRNSLILLVAGGALAWGLTTASPAFATGWTNFNYRLSAVALDQHPVALVRLFAARLPLGDLLGQLHQARRNILGQLHLL